MSTEEKTTIVDRIFDTSGVMDTLINLQRENPDETITLMDMALKTLTGSEKDQFVNEMEKHAFACLSERKQLEKCKGYVHPENKKYKLFGIPYMPGSGYNDFIGAFHTVEECMNESLNHKYKRDEFQIVENDKIIYTAEVDLTFDNDEFGKVNWSMLIEEKKTSPEKASFTLTDMALKTLTGIEKEQFINEMEKHAFAWLSENKQLEKCKEYVHGGNKKYKLFQIPYIETIMDNSKAGGYRDFLGAFRTLKECMDETINYKHALWEFHIVVDDKIIYTGEVIEDVENSLFGQVKWSEEN